MSPSPPLTDLSPETAYRLGLLQARYQFAPTPVKDSFHLWLLAYGWKQFSTQFRLFDRSGDPHSLTRTNALPERRFFCLLVAETADERVALWARRVANISRSSQAAEFDLDGAREMSAIALAELVACPRASPVERAIALCRRLKGLPAFAEPLQDFRIEDQGGPLPYGMREPHGGAWAAAIALASRDLGFDLLGGLPLFGVVQRQLFRLDFAIDRAQPVVESGLGRSVTDALEALHAIDSGLQLFDSRLRASGRSSATFEVWMALHGVDCLAPAQIYSLLNHSPSTLFRALQRLRSHGLVQVRGDSFVGRTPGEAVGSPSPASLDSVDYSVFDQALSDVDALLERYRMRSV